MYTYTTPIQITNGFVNVSKYDAWTDIIEGLRILVNERDKQKSKGTIRVAYLLNKWNSSIEELTNFIKRSYELIK